MDKRGREIIESVNTLKMRIANAVLRAVVFNTPVDTGRARSNWIVTRGSPANWSRLAFAPGQGLGAGETANAIATIEAGNGAIALAQPADNLFITNNVQYIRELNQGKSTQAGSHFVQRAVLSGLAEVQLTKVLRF